MAADLPGSEHAPSDASVPTTPEGYRDPERFDYSPTVLGLGSVLLPRVDGRGHYGPPPSPVTRRR